MMKEDKTAVRSSTGKENEPVMENATKKKTKEEKPPTKVVVRRLPPSMTEEQFKIQVSPMPDFDYFYFVAADMSLTPNAFSRAYINFIDQNDLFIFTQKFDGYVFVDSKGGEYPAVVEFAPFQRIPKNRPNRKKDSKVGTIEADPIYVAFKERMEAENLENKTSVNTSKQHFFETSLAPEKKEETNNTPLLDYIRNKRAERQRIREEKREEKRKKDLERRRAKEEQRRVKKEDETSVVKNLSPSTTSPNPNPIEILLEHLEKKNSSSKIKVKEQQSDTSESRKLPSKQPTEMGKADKDREITKKVRDLVNLFSKTVNQNIKESVKDKDIFIPNCKKHKDIETEMMKNMSDEKEIKSKPLVMSEVPSIKKLNFLNVPMVGCEPSGSCKSYPIPVLNSRGGVPVYVSRNNRGAVYTRSNSDIIMRPVRINPPRNDRIESERGADKTYRSVRPIRVPIQVVHSNRRGCDQFSQSLKKPYEVRPPVRVAIPLNPNLRKNLEVNTHEAVKKSCEVGVSNTTKKCEVKDLRYVKNEGVISRENTKKCLTTKSSSPSDILRKNLQKVVADVLGNAKVSNPKEGIINKPKTFVRRGFFGSGDECEKQGFNSPSFYLPPRAFGCGIKEETNSKDNKFCNEKTTQLPKHCATFTGTAHVAASVSKSLPPFSKKYASSSKSDGDIEKIKTEAKAGGSEESLRSVPSPAFVVRRPYIASRKSVTVVKNTN